MPMPLLRPCSILAWGGACETGCLCMQNRPEFLFPILPHSRPASCPFNVNYRYTANELRYLIGNADAEAVVSEPGVPLIARRFAPASPDVKLWIVVDAREAMPGHWHRVGRTQLPTIVERIPFLRLGVAR